MPLEGCRAVILLKHEDVFVVLVPSPERTCASNGERRQAERKRAAKQGSGHVCVLR